MAILWRPGSGPLNSPRPITFSSGAQSMSVSTVAQG
jgi:hypothetical protein